MTLFYVVRDATSKIIQRGRSSKEDPSVMATVNDNFFEYVMGMEVAEKGKRPKSDLWGWTRNFEVQSLSCGAYLKRTSTRRGYPDKEIVLPRKGARATFLFQENKHVVEFSQGRPIRK